MQIIISGRGVRLTDAIEDYVGKKLNAVAKFFSGIIRADIVLGEDTKRHQQGNLFFAEGRLEVPGYDVFVRREASSLYEAVDSLKDHLERRLKKHKAKLRGELKKTKEIVRENKEYQE
ncbi:MAG: ribosome-associated translation inhibitor RaiA [Candidatus Magasanikbacteria bacterium]|nr:ribosome-associated translation inhibitor RaiA [Candidatus Magasanikbacteria bacterium]